MADNRSTIDLRGVTFGAVTPFSEDGESVRYDDLGEQISRMGREGAGTILACGNVGEYYSLTDEERVDVVETTVTASDPETTVIGGATGSTREAAELINQYASGGADAALLMHPDHTFIHARGLVEYYDEILDRVDLPVVIYVRGPEFTSEIIAELARRPGVLGIKYAVDDLPRFSRAVAGGGDDVTWITGLAERSAPAYALEGAEGFTTGIGCFVPEAPLALMSAIREGDWERAIAIRNLLAPLEEIRDEPGENNHVAAANNVPVLKHGLSLVGLYGGPVRAPLAALSEADEARVERQYDHLVEALTEVS